MTQARNPSPASTGAGAPEVTDEMYEAGRQVLEQFYFGDGVYCLTRKCIMEMYRAMDAVRYGAEPEDPRIAAAGHQSSRSIVAVLES